MRWLGSWLLSLAMGLIALGFAVMGSTVMGCAPSGPPPSAPNAILNKALPRFSKPAMSGGEVSTEAPGKVVVVKFFAKYCEPCKKTLPAAERLHRELGDVSFIGIAEDEHEDDVADMIKTYDITFPVIHDRGNVLAGRFRISQLPATFVADGKGTVLWVGMEGQTEADLAAAIDWARHPAQ